MRGGSGNSARGGSRPRYIEGYEGQGEVSTWVDAMTHWRRGWRRGSGDSGEGGAGSRWPFWVIFSLFYSALYICLRPNRSI